MGAVQNGLPGLKRRPTPFTHEGFDTALRKLDWNRSFGTRLNQDVGAELQVVQSLEPLQVVDDVVGVGLACVENVAPAASKGSMNRKVT